jgi:hypothetical protein
LISQVLHSEGWVQEGQALTLSGESPAWVEYPFQSTWGEEITILVDVSGNPISLKMVLDGRPRTFNTAQHGDTGNDQLLLTHKTVFSPAYFVDFLPEILLLAVGIFILLSSLMLHGLSQEAHPVLAGLYWRLSAFVGFAGTLLYAWAAVFTRPFGDDYCYTNYVRKIGYGPAVLDFYNNWSGRFFSNLLLLGFSEQRWRRWCRSCSGLPPVPCVFTPFSASSPVPDDSG